jgi:hypothetical protein
MLFPTAGSRIYIADSPAAPGSVPGGAWVEIGEAEAIGSVGGQWELHDETDCEDTITRPFKGIQTPGVVQLVFGLDPADPGQVLLRDAFRSIDDFAFRIVLRGETISRQWRALVVSLSEVFDSANAIIKLQADLQMTSEPWRSED